MNFQKFQLKWKIVKHFARSKQRTALRNLFSLPPTHPPPDKTLLHLGNKIFFKEIYRNIQTFAFKVLQECSSWVSRNDAVQIFFLTPHRNMFARKFVKSERFLAVLGSILFSLSTELRIILAKLYCKMCDLFCKLFLFLRLSARSFEIKKKFSDCVHWNVWTTIKTLYARNTIFKKRIPNMRF